ncbi:glycosyltransferase [Algoriphagus sanaruensis]|uniref:Glycosyl transferase family 1 domain-containing protein n=1 Tax=Algoriphagus sanaruensis TaxID=1727163 RepID=A0A142EQS3_9BACT|nr:glycosyltransferase [Algoriphagus sanaruensis]AMQ57478.1 hypothetical protein AO498_13600 [Algoriphagus sanaruensis]
MKILFTQDALVNAGAERSHLEILSRFSEELDVGFVYFYPKHDLREAYERAGIRLFFLNIPEGYHFTLAVSRLISLIRKEKPDLLVSSLWRADIITRIASFFTGVPLVGTLVNDSYAPMAWTDKKGFKYKVVYWVDRLTAGIPCHWIANAHALADSHVKTLGIERGKISVVYRGRPVIASAAKQSFEENSKPKEKIASATKSPEDNSKLKESSLAMTSPVETASAAESFDIKSEISDSSLPPQRAGAVTNPEETAYPDSVGIPVTDDVIAREERPKQSLMEIADRFVVRESEPIRNFISYGRLLERKGFQDAIRAFAKVYETYPDCTLTIFGEGLYRNQLETLIQELKLQNAVFLPGRISNPMELLISNWNAHRTSDIGHRTSFHCFLFPSWYEGFSGALVEAMMAGIPIIASDIPMNLEAIEDKKTALVFRVQNIEELAKQIIWSIEHPEAMQNLGTQARRISEERFDIEKIAKQYEDVLKSLYHQLSQSH